MSSEYLVWISQTRIRVASSACKCVCFYVSLFSYGPMCLRQINMYVNSLGTTLVWRRTARLYTRPATLLWRANSWGTKDKVWGGTPLADNGGVRDSSVRKRRKFLLISVHSSAIYTVSQKTSHLWLAIIFTYMDRLQHFLQKCCREGRQSKCTLFPTSRN